MSLTKEVTIDQITVEENGIILVREVTKVIENDVEISKQYHRTSLYPGQDLTDQPTNVVAIATAIWTSEVISKYQAQQLANAPVKE
jgi:hypothetical protein